MRFTFFTSVRNRKHTLGRVFESLKAQTLKDFEWIIVDNDSSDGVHELYDLICREASFPVRVLLHKADYHVARAMNNAVRLARGDIFIRLDSDDSCIPTTLETFDRVWKSIPEAERGGYSGVNVLCLNDFDGSVVGEEFPQSPMDSNNLDLVYRYRILGEKWGCLNLAALKRFRNPRTLGYVNENHTWFRLAQNYKVRCVNERLRVYHHDQSDRLSVKMKGKPASELIGRYLADAFRLIDNWDVIWPLNKREVAIYLLDLVRTALHSGRSLLKTFFVLDSSLKRFLYLAAIPFGFAIVLRDRLRGKVVGPLLWRLI